MELVYENVERVLDEVIDQANNLKGYANSQIAKVTDSINQALAAAQVQFPELSLTGITVTADGTLPPLPDAPTMPEIEDLPTSFAVPAFSPAIGGSGVDLSGAPVLTAQAPALNYPSFPAWQNVPMPPKPDATQYAVPDKPALAFGAVPELRVERGGLHRALRRRARGQALRDAGGQPGALRRNRDGPVGARAGARAHHRVAGDPGRAGRLRRPWLHHSARGAGPAARRRAAEGPGQRQYRLPRDRHRVGQAAHRGRQVRRD